jgi:hypothetical protein
MDKTSVHTRETQVAEARWADRTGMEGKVLDRSVVVAVATGSSTEPAATLRPSYKLGPSPLAHLVVDLFSRFNL